MVAPTTDNQKQQQEPQPLASPPPKTQRNYRQRAGFGQKHFERKRDMGYTEQQNWYNNLRTKAQEGFNKTPAQRAQEQLGYVPTWGQDPKEIVKAYQLIKATPEGQELPPHIQDQKDYISVAYDYFSQQNGGKPDTEWKHLAADDGGLDFLSGIQGPAERIPFEKAITAEGVKEGTNQWAELDPETRQALLSNPSFNILDYPKIQHSQILSDENFDWSRVPKWQKTYFELSSNPSAMGAAQGALMGATGGPGGLAVGGGLGALIGWGAYKSGYDPTKEAFEQTGLIATGFGLMNWAAETLEKGAGWTLMGIGVATGNLDLSPKELFSRQALQAGSLGYEAFAQAAAAQVEEDKKKLTAKDALKIMPGVHSFTVMVDLLLNPEKYGRMEVYLGHADPVKVQGKFYDAYKEAYDRIGAGEDYRDVMIEMQTGIIAQVGDMLGQAVADPLNVMPKVETKVGAKIAEATGHETAARALSQAHAPMEAAMIYRSLVQSADVPQNFNFSEMGSLARWVAGVTEEGKVKAGPFTQKGLLDAPRPKEEKAGFLTRLKEDWMSLTPEARAREGASMFYNNVSTLLSSMNEPSEIVTMFRALTGGDMKTWRDMAGKVANSPEWYTVLPALKEFDVGTLDNLVSRWEVGQAKRDILLKLADILGDEPGKLIDDLAKRGTANEDYARIRHAVEQSNSPEAKVILDMINRGEFTAASLQDVVNAFTGEGALPWHPGQWRAEFIDALGNHFDEWTATTLRLADDPQAHNRFYRTAHLLKSAQSIMLLGLSPGYAITNGLSNMVHRAATGIYGYMTPKQINDFLGRFGVTPARLDEGFGIGGLIEAADTPGVLKVEKIQGALRSDDALARAQDMVSSVARKMPFNKLSGAMEKLEGRQGFVIAMKKMWSQSWRRGVGFQRMDANLVKAITDIGVDPNIIYSAIEAGMRQSDIEAAIYGKQVGIQARSLVTEAAQSSGISASDAAQMLDQIGLLDALDQYLTRADSIDKVDAAFNRATKHAQEAIDIRVSEDAIARAEHAHNRVVIEGAKALTDIITDVEMQGIEKHLQHYERMGIAAEKMDTLDDPALRRRVWAESYEESTREYRRYNALRGSTYLGIVKAIGLEDNPHARGFLATMGDIDRVMDEAYAFMREARDNHYEKWSDNWGDPKQYKERDAVDAAIDRKWREALKAEETNMRQMGELLGKQYEAMYGVEAGEAARQAWETIARFRKEMTKRQQAFRKMQKQALEMGVPYAERQAAAKEFWGSTYKYMIVEMARVKQEAIARLDAIVRGDNTPPPSTPPVGPEGPDTPNAPQAPDQMAELRQQAEARAEEKRQAISNVWDIAEELGGSDFSRTEFGNKFHLLNTLKKAEYGGDPSIKLVEDIPEKLSPERIREIFAKRAEEKALEAATKAAEVERRVEAARATKLEEVKQRVSKGKSVNNTRLLTAIKQAGGIDYSVKDVRVDITGEANAVGWQPGIFRNKSASRWGIDQMASIMANEWNFPIDLNDPADPGGVNQLIALMQKDHGGDEVYPMTRDLDAAAEAEAAAEIARLEAQGDIEAQEAETTRAARDIDIWEAEVQRARNDLDLNALTELMGTLPVDGTKTRKKGENYNDYISRVWDEAIAEQTKAEHDVAIAENITRAQMAVEDAHKAAEYAMTREVLKEKYAQAFPKATEDQITAWMEVSDRVLETIGKYTSSTKDEMYTRYKDILRGPEGEGGLLHQSAWHGSPYNFPKFQLDKIGEGEGNQAFGWGLYFAGNKQVAEGYRTALANQKVTYKGLEFHELGSLPEYGETSFFLAQDIMRTMQQQKRQAASVMAELWDWAKANKERKVLDALREMKPSDFYMQEGQGQLYKVQLPDENANYLLWDRSFKEQPRAVQEAAIKASPEIKNLIAQIDNDTRTLFSQTPDSLHDVIRAMINDDPANLTNGRNDANWQRIQQEAPNADANLIHDIQDAWDILDNKYTGETIYNLLSDDHGGYRRSDNDKAASLALNAEGIVGIKYLDGDSRPTTPLGRQVERAYTMFDGDIQKAADYLEVQPWASSMRRTDLEKMLQKGYNYNYVVFDDSAVHILETFYQSEGTYRKGGVDFLDGRYVISAYDGAGDISTIAHENAHIFLDMMRDAARRTGNANLLDDMATFSDWARLEKTGDIWSAVNGEDFKILQDDTGFIYIDPSGESRTFGTYDEARYVLEHEMFARGFEKYLADGSAPTPKLRRVFENFKTWLLSIYQGITGSQIDVNITDSMRDVFDRMLGEERTKIKEIQEVVIGKSDQRRPAYDNLRTIWKDLDKHERTEALDWVLQKSLVDPLSGMETLVARELSGPKPLGWVDATTDLNALKFINDTLGHEAGDQVIKVLGQIAREEAEKVGGRAFRVGGDENAYWFPSEPLAKQALEAIDSRLLETEIEINGVTRKGFSVSTGYGDDFHAADAMLYKDKERRTALGQRAERGVRPESIVDVIKRQADEAATFDPTEGDIVMYDDKPMRVERDFGTGMIRIEDVEPNKEGYATGQVKVHKSHVKPAETAAPQVEAAPQAVSLQPEQLRPDFIGLLTNKDIPDYGRFENGVFYTRSGREVEPPPIRTDSDRKLNIDLKKVDAWLVDEAIKEADYRQDTYNSDRFEFSMNARKLSPADRTSLNDYLFGVYDIADLIKAEGYVTEPEIANALFPKEPEPGDTIVTDGEAFKFDGVDQESGEYSVTDATGERLTVSPEEVTDVSHPAPVEPPQIKRYEVRKAAEKDGGGYMVWDTVAKTHLLKDLPQQRAERIVNNSNAHLREMATPDAAVLLMERIPGIEGTEFHILKNTAQTRLYTVALYDVDIKEYLPTLRQFNGIDALENAIKYAQEVAVRADPIEAPAPTKVSEHVTAQGLMDELVNAEGPRVKKKAKPKPKKPLQPGLFGEEDTPLFSQTPQPAETEVFAPKPEIKQESFVDTRPEFGQRVEENLVKVKQGIIDETPQAVPEPIKPSKESTLLDALSEKLDNNEWFEKAKDFETFIKTLDFDVESEADLNLAYDIMEGAYNLKARKIREFMDANNAPIGERLAAMEGLENQLTEARRTLGKMKLQQFSTPLTLSEAAAFVADVRPGDVLGEPTAGTGNLVDRFKAQQFSDVEIRVNEIDAGRRRVLEMIGYDTTGLNLMTGEWLLADGKKLGPWATVQISNPPWGSYSTGKYGTATNVPVKLNDWSQRFAYLSLMRMPEGGRYVGVMPTNWLFTMDRKTRLITEKPSMFYRWLEKNYTVQAVIESPTGAYKNRATDIGSLLVVIDKKTPLFEANPVEAWGKTRPANWDEYANYLERVPKRLDEDVTNAIEQVKKTESKAGPNESGIIDPAARAGNPKADAENIGKPPKQADTSRPLEDVAGQPRPRGDDGISTGGTPEPTESITPRDDQPRGERQQDNSQVVAGENGGDYQGDNQPFEYSGAFLERLQSQRNALSDTGSFAEYLPRSPLAPDEVGSPHPALIVETKALAGVPYPELETAYRPTKTVMQAMKRRALSHQGNIDAIWSAIQANDKHHMGLLVADDVGTGKSRTAAGFVIDRLERGQSKILVITKNQQNVDNLMSEFRLVYGNEANEIGSFGDQPPQGDFPAQFIQINKSAMLADAEGNLSLPPTDKPTVYFATVSGATDFYQQIVSKGMETMIVDEAHEWKNLDAGNAKHPKKMPIAWVNMHKDLISRKASLLYLTATPGADLTDFQYLYGLRAWTMDGFKDWVDIITGQKTADQVKKSQDAGDAVTAWMNRIEDAATKLDYEPVEVQHSRWNSSPGFKIGELEIWESRDNYNKGEWLYKLGDGEEAKKGDVNAKSHQEALIIADMVNRRIKGMTVDLTHSDLRQIFIDSANDYIDTYQPPGKEVISDLGDAGIKEASDIAAGKSKKWGTGKRSAYESTIPPAHTEQIMRELKSAGVYMSRDISRAGVDFEIKKLTPSDAKRAQLNERIDLYRKIHEAFYRWGKANEGPKKAAALYGVSGDIQNDAKRMLFDMRLEQAMKEIDAAVENGEGVVFSVVSVGEVDGESGSLANAISKINTHMVEKIGEGEYSNPTEIPEALIEVVTLQEELAALPKLASPIDILKERYGDRVGYVTGAVPDKQRTKVSRDFQRGKLDIVVISGAGKTGINLHDIAGQRRHHLIVGDFEWSPSNFKQELGRVDRTGQKSSPKVTVLHLGQAGEIKFISTIANRMKGLGAASKGAAESTGTGALSSEFELGQTMDRYALKQTWESLSPDDRLLFLDKKFVDQNVGAPVSTIDMTADTFARFFKAMQAIPLEDSERIANVFWETRAALMEGDEYKASQAEKNNSFTGEVLRRTELAPNLAINEVRNVDGQKYAVLDGILTPHMNGLKALLGARNVDDISLLTELGPNAWQKWTRFYDPAQNKHVSGLKVLAGRIKAVLEHYGQKGIGHSPATAWVDLRSGDKIKINGSNLSDWELYLGKGGAREDKIVVDGAKMKDRDAIMKNGGLYSAQGNFFYVPQDRLADFFMRFPINNDDANPPTLHQSAPINPDADPKMPLGGYEQAAGWLPESEALDQGWTEQIMPLLENMRDVAKKRVTSDKPFNDRLGSLSGQDADNLRRYVSNVGDDMNAVKMSTIKHGESMRDYSMLNYNRRYGFDKMLDVFIPYQLFYTRSLMTWAMRGIDKPSWYANYARIRRQQNRYERDLPERLRNKIKINAPWLPDWMGDALYIDPLQNLFTPANFARPFETMTRDKNSQVIEAERILQEWAADGSVSEGQIAEAARTQEGSLWERAISEAQVRRESQISSPFDFFSSFFGPAWYLSTPLNLMGIQVPGLSAGDKNKVSTTPILNTTRAFETVTKDTWLEPVGKLIGLAGKPEEWVRDKLELPTFGEYGEYYIDRQLANMVADGLIDADTAQRAMIERQGDVFEQAKERVKMELSMRVPLAGATYATTHEGVLAGAQAFLPSLFGSGLLPEGELKYRGLKDDWEHAWKQYDRGNKDAINKFFTDHPEYEAYLAKGKEPADKLRSYLIGNIWDGYMSLGETHKKQVRQALGEDFNNAFLNKETRAYDAINLETLVRWSQQIGAVVPRTEATAPQIEQPASQVRYLPDTVINVTDHYFEERKKLYPDYYKLEQGYYLFPKSERSRYLAKHPKLKEYWDWKKRYYKKYPDLVPIFSGKAFKQQTDTSTWTPGLEGYVMTYAFTGQKLPKGAYEALRMEWMKAGMPFDDLDSWLNSQLVPSFLYAQGE